MTGREDTPIICGPSSMRVRFLATLIATALCSCELEQGLLESSARSRISVRDAVVEIHEHAPANATAYMTIMNASSDDDRLLSVASTGIRAALTREHISSGAGARIEDRPNGFAVPARRAITLDAGGKHILLKGLAGDLSPGDSLLLNLEFERSGSLAVQAVVRPVTG